jgi:nicotinamidase-related amidase
MGDLRLSPDASALLVVDFQDKLAAVMPADSRTEATQNIVRLIRGAGLLGVRVLVTEQYPKGLGPTVEPVRAALDAVDSDVVLVEKLEFDACANSEFQAVLRGLGAYRSFVVCGMEAHICVYQTTRGLIEAGYSVHVPLDATCARLPDNRRIAQGLWDRAGATVTSTEAVLFASTRSFSCIFFRGMGPGEGRREEKRCHLRHLVGAQRRTELLTRCPRVTICQRWRTRARPNDCTRQT